MFSRKPCYVPRLEERLSGSIWTYPDGDWLFDKEKEEEGLDGDELPDIFSPSASLNDSASSAKWDLSKPCRSKQEVLKELQSVIDPPLAGQELETLKRYATYMNGLLMSRASCEARHHRFHILERHARDHPEGEAGDGVEPGQSAEERARKLAGDALKSRWTKMGYWEEGRIMSSGGDYEEELPFCSHPRLMVSDCRKTVDDCLRCSLTLDGPIVEDAAKRRRSQPPKIHNPAPNGHGLHGLKHRLFVQSRPWFLFEMGVLEEKIRFWRLKKPVRMYFNKSDSHDIRNPAIRVAELWKSWGGVYEAAITNAREGAGGIPLIGWQWRQESGAKEPEMDVPELPPPAPRDERRAREDAMTPAERVKKRRKAKTTSKSVTPTPKRVVKRESTPVRRSTRKAAARASSRVSETLDPKDPGKRWSESR